MGSICEDEEPVLQKRTEFGTATSTFKMSCLLSSVLWMEVEDEEDDFKKAH